MSEHTRITVAQNLTAIDDLSAQLEDQAINDANDHLMPGGLAMVALAGVANLEAWGHKIEAAERRALEAGASLPIDDDDEWLPPLQTLLFWSDDLRRIHDQEFEPTPHRPRQTEATEVNIIRHHLDWLWENEPKWDDMAADIEGAVKRLEALLTEGLRSKRGVPCLSVECDGGILSRAVEDRREHVRCEGHDGVCTIPHERCPHDRGGLRDEWVCGSCYRSYGTEDYRRAVAQSALLNAEWLPLDKAVQRTHAKRGSIQGWATKGIVRKRKDQDSGRMTYSVADIQGRQNGTAAEPEDGAA